MAAKISILTYLLLVNDLKAKPLFEKSKIDKKKKYKFIEYEKDGQKDSVFLALKRKKQLMHKMIDDHNSHNINVLEKVYERGCRAFIVDNYYHENKKFKDDFDTFIKKYNNELDFVLITKNSMELYYEIANLYRKIINPIIVAITGSVGKTSTTEMIYSILSQHYNVVKSNVYNTFIAISRAVINMPIDTEYLVVEVSSRRLGLMQKNSKILEPDIAVITQIKYEHIKGMGSIDGVAQEKLSITKSMKEKSLLICPNIEHIRKNLDIKYEGEISLIGTRQAKLIKTYTDKSEFYYKDEFYSIPSPGMHNIDNAILSIEVAMRIGLRARQIGRGLKEYKAVGNRWKVDNLKNDIVVINDSPNNPSHATVIASINTLANTYKAYKKVIILSDILELGDYEKELYEDIGSLIDKLNIDELILYGHDVHQIKNKIQNNVTQVKCFEKVISEPIEFKANGELTHYIVPLLDQKTVVLIKASRIMGFDKISNNIIRYLNNEV